MRRPALFLLLLASFAAACAPSGAPLSGNRAAPGPGAEPDAEPMLGGGTLLEGPPGVPEATPGRLGGSTLR